MMPVFFLFQYSIPPYIRGPDGPVAEWLGSALQKLLQRFESARDLKVQSLRRLFCFNAIHVYKSFDSDS